MTIEPSKAELDPRVSALFVIDVQQALFSRPTPIHDAETLLNIINSLIDRWDQAGGLIVYVQHSNKNLLAKGTTGWQIHPSIRVVEAGVRVYKLHGNAFEETELSSTLASRGIEQVVITGLVTQGCVKATCLGALALDYRVVLVKDGHSNYRKDADKIIKMWNRKLVEKGVRLISADGIELHKQRTA